MAGWYIVALGANRRGRFGSPEAQVRAALTALNARAASPILPSAPIGPSIRRFANAVALVDSDAAPQAMLAHLKAIERRFGRRAGRRWGERVIDLDLIAWSGGRYHSRALTVPHANFRVRSFVVGPLVGLAPRWRDPVTNLTPHHLHARLTRPRPVPSCRSTGWGP